MTHQNSVLQVCAQNHSIVQNELVLTEHYQRYLDAILLPDIAASVEVAAAYIHTAQQIPEFWRYVIQPAMYEIGARWADGLLTVGQEHLATAITQRVMAMYYPLILPLPRHRGPVIVAATPGELHEIGPRMLADMLEIQGWNVYYVGANTPSASVLDLIERLQVQAVCLSTTLTQNLIQVAGLIAQIRSRSSASPVQVLVGGQAYQCQPELWQRVGADWCAVSAHEVTQYLDQ
jgi:methanogenic corrinoid protein MtbC1